MATLVVVGAQWGDEAKGKLADVLGDRAKLVVRYGGGSNAGHTVIVGERVFKLHLIPAGVLRPNVVSIVASGVVLEPKSIVAELEKLSDLNVSPQNLKISANAHVVLPYHPQIEAIEEEQRGDAKIGTTNRGIGPAYVDKAARAGVRMIDFISPERFKACLNNYLEGKNHLFRAYDQPVFEVDRLVEEYAPIAEKLKPFVCEVEPIIYDHVAAGDNVIFEGAQGTLLDLDYGTYPFVTSSHPVAAGACLGTGIGPKAIDQTLGVAKAYTTRVGAGPMPTELLDETGAKIREKGHEYGTTTGRPRRCGWLDLLALKYAAQVNSLTSLAITRLDVLDSFETVSICTGYRVNGEILTRFSSDVEILSRAEPVYETLPGWLSDTTHAKRWDALPANAQTFLKRIEDFIGTPISIVSVGPEREQTILAHPDLLWG